MRKLRYAPFLVLWHRRHFQPGYTHTFHPPTPPLPRPADVESLETSRLLATVTEHRPGRSHTDVRAQTTPESAPTTHAGSECITTPDATTFPRSEFPGDLRGRGGGVFFPRGGRGRSRARRLFGGGAATNKGETDVVIVVVFSRAGATRPAFADATSCQLGGARVFVLVLSETQDESKAERATFRQYGRRDVDEIGEARGASASKGV